MNRKYWEMIAPAYGDEIFDVLQHDKKAFIRSAIKKYAGKRKTVMDIGCAIGKWLPVLSPAFKEVVAVDISSTNLEIAKKLYPEYKNVVYLRADMSGEKTKVPACDFAVCINAILTPSLQERTIFFQSLSACVKKRGHMIITVPSLESWLLTSIVQYNWKIDRAHFPAKTPAKVAVKKWENIRQGNADIDEVPHKHYLKEELQLLLSKAGFVAESFRKIEYAWTTEFHRPPAWLRQPGPWDWMVVARKL